jgi:[ribosomal protein S5]-alanine N-acetyltransferase
MTLASDIDRIESERLLLRRITRDDYDFFARLHATPEVRRYIGNGQPQSAEESRAWVERVAMYKHANLGFLAVVRKSDGRLIGRCGLSELVVDAKAATGTIPRGWFQRAQAPAGAALLETPDLGYTFDPASWGHGYATEAARCVFDYARANLEWPRIVSVIHPDNVRSLRVAERSGLRRDGQVAINEQVMEQYVWPPTLATWTIDPVHSSGR